MSTHLIVDLDSIRKSMLEVHGGRLFNYRVFLKQFDELHAKTAYSSHSYRVVDLNYLRCLGFAVCFRRKYSAVDIAAEVFTSDATEFVFLTDNPWISPVLNKLAEIKKYACVMGVNPPPLFKKYDSILVSEDCLHATAKATK